MKWWLSVLAAVAACSSSSSPSPDAEPGFVTAPHTPLPSLVKHTGAILDHVKLVTITPTDYAQTATVEAFGDAIVTSSWYTDAGAEYGVGAGTHDAKVHIAPYSTTQPLKDTDLDALIQQLIANNMVPRPPATGSEYLYMFYIPPNVPLDASLMGFYGYHTDATASGARFAYAIILDDGSGIDTTTSTAAHELIEAATDPYSPPQDGYYADPPNDDPWYYILGEIADLCNGEALIKSGTYAVQRTWSNAAIAAGKSPCVPYDPDDIWMDVSAEPAKMPHVAAGGTATFTLTGWSTSQVADWSLDTYTADYSDLDTTQTKPQLSATTINNGQTVTLTLYVPANASSGQTGVVYVLSGHQLRPWAVGYIVQ